MNLFLACNLTYDTHMYFCCKFLDSHLNHMPLKNTNVQIVVAFDVDKSTFMLVKTDILGQKLHRVIYEYYATLIYQCPYLATLV